jgi:hypothetical protein
VFEGAVAAARALDRSIIRAPHVLPALLDRSDGVAAQVPTDVGTDRELVRQQLLEAV